MNVAIRSVSGYEALERWAAARNQAGPDVLSPHTEAQLRATEHEHVGLLALRGRPPERRRLRAARRGSTIPV